MSRRQSRSSSAKRSRRLRGDAPEFGPQFLEDFINAQRTSCFRTLRGARACMAKMLDRFPRLQCPSRRQAKQIVAQVDEAIAFYRRPALRVAPTSTRTQIDLTRMQIPALLIQERRKKRPQKRTNLQKATRKPKTKRTGAQRARAAPSPIVKRRPKTRRAGARRARAASPPAAKHKPTRRRKGTAARRSPHRYRRK